MIAAILGAWKGSEARFGVLPQITVATDRGTVSALPFTATDLDGNSFTNPVPEFVIGSEHTLTNHLAKQQYRSPMAGSLRHHARANSRVCQRQVTNAVHGLVSHEFVGPP